jgi:hypothetical protein
VVLIEGEEDVLLVVLELAVVLLLDEVVVDREALLLVVEDEVIMVLLDAALVLVVVALLLELDRELWEDEDTLERLDEVVEDALLWPLVDVLEEETEDDEDVVPTL